MEERYLRRSSGVSGCVFAYGKTEIRVAVTASLRPRPPGERQNPALFGAGTPHTIISVMIQRQLTILSFLQVFSSLLFPLATAQTGGWVVSGWTSCTVPDTTWVRDVSCPANTNCTGTRPINSTTCEWSAAPEAECVCNEDGDDCKEIWEALCEDNLGAQVCSEEDSNLQSCELPFAERDLGTSALLLGMALSFLMMCCILGTWTFQYAKTQKLWYFEKNLTPGQSSACLSKCGCCWGNPSSFLFASVGFISEVLFGDHLYPLLALVVLWLHLYFTCEYKHRFLFFCDFCTFILLFLHSSTRTGQTLCM